MKAFKAGDCHTAVRAGLGQMGKNTLLINDQLGNMLWLGAVLVAKELEPDLIADYQACIPGC
jgi:epoxyqueuosine reductase QueG